jgi:repressor LexA
MAKSLPIDLDIFAKNIKYLRERYGWTQIELARNLGYTSFATVSKWESAKSAPRHSAVMQLCEKFNVTRDDLFMTDLSTGRTRMTQKIEEESKPDMITVYSDAPGGELMEMYAIGRENLKPGLPIKEYIAFKIEDDSMYPFYVPRDILIIRKREHITATTDCLISIAGGQAMVRRVTPKGDLYHLATLNPRYVGDIVAKEDMKIVGIVTELRRRF